MMRCHDGVRIVKECLVSLTLRISVSALTSVTSERRPPRLEPLMRRSPAKVRTWLRPASSLPYSWIATACQLCSLQYERTSSRISELSPQALY